MATWFVYIYIYVYINDDRYVNKHESANLLVYLYLTIYVLIGAIKVVICHDFAICRC